MLACEDKNELERQLKAWCDCLEMFTFQLNVKKTKYLTTKASVILPREHPQNVRGPMVHGGGGRGEARRLASGLPTALSCQDVDIFEHKTTVCSTSKSNRQVCKVVITEVIKINSFSKEACFRLQNQGIKEIRIKWNELRLLCDKHTTMFTRNTILRVLDTKRFLRFLVLPPVIDCLFVEKHVIKRLLPSNFCFTSCPQPCPSFIDSGDYR
ncbi:unnamed protein product [Heligmosomoides polygyrus]|uniref:Phlebovirus_G2 domain-containing protein n=1 Tax=Heligmosomoides polygyrus TaxID=6339 RepID=A0A183GQZ0_HELPZ|nr:unnamed protein product [Heligmosomoides polygyrus]